MCSVFVTAGTASDEVLAEVAAAAVALDVPAEVVDGALEIDGRIVRPEVLARAHPSPAELAALVAIDGPRTGMVVADRISEAGREVLRAAGWGWLDRRGHLRLWATGTRIDSPLPDAARPGRSVTAEPWTTVGLEIAVAALCQPETPVAARRLAGEIGRSVGATHELIGRFVDVGLIGPKTRLPLLPELFDETAARWPDDGWTALAAPIAEVADRVGPGELVRVDERAATLGGAQIAAANDLPARCYVGSAAALRRTRALAVGTDRSGADGPTRTWVRSAPVRWLPTNEEHPPDDAHPWFVAHPIVCALRLARDPARGREIVDAWGIVPGGRR